MSLKIRIITPDKIVWNTTTTEVILPSTTGPLGILNDHAPLITALDIGVLRIKTNDSWEPIILLGGFAEINNNIIVLVNGVEEIKKGDVTAAFNEVEDASLVLENAKTDKEKLKASQNLKRIASRAQVLTFFYKKKY